MNKTFLYGIREWSKRFITKQQPIEDAGKVLGIGADGKVMPVDGGGTAEDVTYDEEQDYSDGTVGKKLSSLSEQKINKQQGTDYTGQPMVVNEDGDIIPAEDDDTPWDENSKLWNAEQIAFGDNSDVKKELEYSKAELKRLENAKLDEEKFDSEIGSIVTETINRFAETTAHITALDLVTTVPASASAIGNPGQVCITTEYVYLCIAVDTWRRTALESF